MAIREILTQGDPVLKKVCHPVTKFDEKLAHLMDDLKETLAYANGMGLAAPQVGILRRAQNREGEWFEVEGTDIVARCFCHELSHLEGHLYTELTDRLYTSEELDELLAEQDEEREEQEET
jgi:peptide deformylase